MNNKIELTIDKNKYTIVLTKHADKRMSERNIDPFVVVGNIIVLGKERLSNFHNTEAMIIDEDRDTSFVIGVNKETITIITVIDKSNIFVKTNTQVVNL